MVGEPEREQQTLEVKVEQGRASSLPASLPFFLLSLPVRERLSQRGGGFAIHRNGAYHGIYADSRSLGDFNFLENSGGGRGNFCVNLVGGDLEQRFAALDLIARLFQPLGN